MFLGILKHAWEPVVQYHQKLKRDRFHILYYMVSLQTLFYKKTIIHIEFDKLG